MKKYFALALVLFFGEPARAATVVVQMQNNFFSPSVVNIKVGDTVTWVQRGSNHDSVSYDGLWDSGLLRLNQTFSHTFNTAGSFRYYCTPHEQIGMIGTVNVTGTANNPPTVTLTAPTGGTTFTTADTITFSATATDDGTVVKVEFFSDGNLIGTDTTVPYSVTGSLAAGSHSITARATDDAGATASSSAASINVEAPAVNQPPTVALTSSAEGTQAAPASFVLRAEAADSDGSVTQVEFFNGGTSLGMDSSAPFEAAVNGLAAGIYSFTAVAKDNSGAETTSAAVTVMVAAAPRITGIARNAAEISLSVAGTSGVPHVLEASSDLNTWSAIATNTPAADATVFQDSATEPKKFYRVVVK